MAFDINDSGVRQVFDSGMVRDVTDGKTDYTLALDGPMFDRWAEHLTKGAKKYDARNWMKASGKDEYARFKQSALRHFLQWFRGEEDEDHAAAVFFNINGAEYVSDREFTEFEDDMCVNCVTPWKCNGPHLDGGQYEPVVEWDDELEMVNATDYKDPNGVGDVDANDILDMISQPGGAGDLADDYNYLRNRVKELSDRFYPTDSFDDGGW